jgi:serine/threonine-protein kinase
MFAARMATWALGTHHVTALFGEVNLFVSALQAALYWAGMAGFMYLAFEPYLRKSAPERVISWTRLLSGDWRDPLVGRDVLVGGMAGIGVNILAVVIIQWLPSWLGRPAPSLNLVTGQGPGGGPFVGVGGFPDMLFDKLSESLIAAFILSFLILFLGLLLRRKWLGVAAIWLILMVANIIGSQNQTSIELAAGCLALSGFVLIAARFGVLAMISMWLFIDIMNRPVTTDLSAWYASEFVLYAAMLIGLAIFGCYTSTAGQKLWTGKLFDE